MLIIDSPLAFKRFFCFNIIYNMIKELIDLERKVVLSPKKIVDKEFKVDFKGYNPVFRNSHHESLEVYKVVI